MPNSEENTMGITNGWRIDKRIPVAVIMTLAIQSAAVLVWGVRLDSRVYALETGTVTTEKFGRLDEKMTTVKDDISSLRGDFRELKEEMRRGSVTGKR